MLMMPKSRLEAGKSPRVIAFAFFVHSFNKQLLKSYSEKYCEGLVYSISVALMTILTVIRLVQVEAPIEKNLICLLVGGIFLVATLLLRWFR